MHRSYYWGLVLGVCGVVAAGCGSVTPHSRLVAPKQAEAPVPSPTRAAASIPSPPQAIDISAVTAAKAHAHFATGLVYEMNDDPESALKEYYEAALNDPANEWLILEVSRRFAQHKELEKAMELLARSAERPNASGAIYARLGAVYSQLGKTEQAVAADRTAIKRSPELLGGYQNLFVTYLQNKQSAEALKVLEEAARQEKTGAEFLLGVTDLCHAYALQYPSQKEKTDALARPLLERVRKLNPSNPSLRLQLAEALSRAGETEKAAPIYVELLGKLPDVPFMRERLRAKLASIYLQSSDRQRATEQLQALVRDDPTNPVAYYYLGSLAYESEKPAEAAEYFSKVLVLKPDFEEAYYDLALANISLNKPGEALEVLNKAAVKFPHNNNFPLEFYRGLAYGRQKSYPEALRHFTEAEIIAKTFNTNALSRVYFQMGSTQERMGAFDEAEKSFEQCLKLDPDFHAAQNYLGYMLAEHGWKLDKARALIEKAVAAEPKNGAYLDSLGWVLFKLNQPKEALDYILKAVELSPEPDATLFDHLGDIYAAVGQPDKAKEAWAKSVKLEPNEDIQKKLQRAGSGE